MDYEFSRIVFLALFGAFKVIVLVAVCLAVHGIIRAIWPKPKAPKKPGFAHQWNMGDQRDTWR